MSPQLIIDLVFYIIIGALAGVLYIAVLKEIVAIKKKDGS
jgi:uncharacterized membrane protein YuzA (DUF378 family)